MLKRLTALILMLAMLVSCAMAEDIQPEEIQPEVLQLEREEVRQFVEALFLAATGVTLEEEKELRKEMNEEEILARNAFNAEYRAKTLPWLMAAFAAEKEIDPEAAPEPTHEPTPTIDPMATPDPDAPIVWTIKDSYAAFAENVHGAAYLELLKNFGGGETARDMEITRNICGMWMGEINHAELNWMNNDYVFWLYGPGTQIDYPVVQGEDNKYYLKRMFNKKRNAAGALFVDYRNLPDFQDPNTLVYGHHMRNDSMFGTLTEYERQSYYESHPYMLVMDGERVYLAELFAGYTTTDKDHCYDIAISGRQDMLDFITRAKEKSDFASAVQVDYTDKLATFSTCAYAFEDARYIVLGRLQLLNEIDAEQMSLDLSETD